MRTTGQIKWRGDFVFISEVLVGEPIGVREMDGGVHMVRFCHRDIGYIDRTARFQSLAPPRARLRSTLKTGGTQEE